MMIVQQIPDSAALVQGVQGWIDGHPISSAVIGCGVLLVIAWVADVVAKRRILGTVDAIVRRTKYEWDDLIHKSRVFQRLSHLLPPLVIYFGISLVPHLSEQVVMYVKQVAAAVLAFTTMLGIGALLTAVNDIYDRTPQGRTHPIKGYVQVVKIVVYVIGTVITVAALMGSNPLLFLSGFGALTAVLMLVFKDTLLSLVASVQIMSDDMVRVGDWIEMPKYNADGDVIDIALHTVKIRNWDNTITTVPTSKFIEDSFRNWRGMTESGARRIKRAILIDQRSIRFLGDNELEKLKKLELLADYLDGKQRELKDFAETVGSTGRTADVKRLTNIGTFRAYVANYLKHHPKVHQDRTVLVRQLAPTASGLPLEVYIFSNDTSWVSFEGIQSDIFDHMLAVLDQFGLKVFQNPTGADFARAFSAPAE